MLEIITQLAQRESSICRKACGSGGSSASSSPKSVAVFNPEDLKQKS
jgi:hypothetical protein